MITVIKHGERREAICKICGCEFLYEKEDIMHGDQREPYCIVKCPDCGHRVELSVLNS